MKKKRFIKPLMILTMFFCTLCFCTVGSLADVGNSNRHSSSGGSSSSRGGSSDQSQGGSWFNIIWIVFVFGCVIYGAKKNKKNSSARSTRLLPVDAQISHLDILRQLDPDFNEQEMLNKAKETFVALQAAWTARDWKPARLLESDTLFNTHKTQLDEYIRGGKINIVERIFVDTVQITRFYDNGENEFLDIALNARMHDYVIDELTRNVVEGNPQKEYRMGYRMTFMRTKGVKTQAPGHPASAGNCPNCGAPLELSAAGECAYCGTLVILGQFSWVLDKLEGENRN